MTQPTQEVWAAMRRPLLAFARRHGAQSEADAEDVVQEVFLRAEQRLDQLRDSTRISAWLFAVTRSVLADEHRRRARHARVTRDGHSELTAEPSGPQPATGSDPAEELAGCVRPLLKTLPQKYRTVLELTELEGLPHKEVAAQLGLSVSGVKTRAQRGRALLRGELEACCRIETDRRRGVRGFERRGEDCACTPSDP